MKKVVFFFSILLISSCQKDKRVVTLPPSHAPTPYNLETPLGFIDPAIPTDNPMTVEGIRLGRRLFYDVRLSGDNTMSCATCHLQDHAFSDPNRFSTGIDGIEGTFNAPPIMNLAWQDFFFWDGRSGSLEAQALLPIEDPIEMHEDLSNAIAKLEADELYPQLFKDAFGSEEITGDAIGKAIAQFERKMVSANSKYDKFRRGEATFTDLEAEGFALFNNETGDCFHCHGDVTTAGIFGAYGAIQFSNNGLDSTLRPNSGREAVTGNPNDRAKFKIPSLRNVEFSAPYMHDGRFFTLEQVVEHYNMGGHPTSTIDPNMKAMGVGRNWSLRQKQALVAFMKTLSDTEFLTDTTLSDPFVN
jgi:cytochrome c peroxidase